MYDTYGRDRTALCATLVRYRAKGALRDVGKALGLTEDVTKALTSQLWGWSEGVEPKHVEGLNLNMGDRRLRLALDLARQLPPTAQLEGLDIDNSQCPPPSWLPPNVTMRAVDALQRDVATDLLCRFDVVHVRLFMFVVEEPGPLLRNVVRMLSTSVRHLFLYAFGARVCCEIGRERSIRGARCSRASL